MRTTGYRFLARFVAVAAIAAATQASAEPPSPFYVPGALAGSDPQIWTDIWAHNNGSAEGVVRFLSVWDAAGALTLPTFTSVVPADTKTIAGSFDISWTECSGFGAARRLNVTLFNAGDAPGTFHVVVQTRDHGISSGPSHSGEPTVIDYLVPPRSVHQINGIPYDLPALCGSGRTWAMGWVEITADQPYLAYASTVRQDAPGVLPYEVFPAVTGQ